MNLKQISSLLAATGLLTACSSGVKTTNVQWESLGNMSDEQGSYYIQRITVSGDLDFDRLAFNQFARAMEPLNPADTLIELVPGYYCIASPRFRAADEDTVVIEIRTKGVLRNVCYEPDGFHRVNADGSTAAVVLTRGGIISRPDLWSTPESDMMPKAGDIYKFNEVIASYETPGPYEVIPSFKNVRLTGGESSSKDMNIEAHVLPSGSGDSYRIIVENGTATIEASPEFMKTARRRCENLVAGFGGAVVPNAVVEDCPDYRYRGVLIDIARNYQTPAQMRRVLDLLARYGFNHLHFHFADDEAWRVDIPGLPELVEVGGRRGYTLDESQFLKQLFCGDGNPSTLTGTSNGYFTEDDFIAMLRYADSLGVKVLPEIESPGHARAAIKAMEKRYRTTGDASMRLIEDGDTSVYTSAQSLRDNIMNPALPSTYVFMERVIDGVIDLYAKAGVELPAIHIGGDEVPRNAWSGSRAIKDFMSANGMTTEKEVHAAFVRRINSYLVSKGVKLSGWQEIAVGHSSEYNQEVASNVYSVNSWTLSSDRQDSPSRQALEGGYPVILSNVDRFYLDMCYSYHPDERGLTWGGTVDEFVSLGGYPAELAVSKDGDMGRVIGLSGQLFAETIRSAAGQETLLLPKMLGLAERAWNGTPTYDDAGFNSIIAWREIPFWEKGGYCYHLRQPGILIEDGLARMNAPYMGIGEIRYTLDGSEPTELSPVYSGEIKLPEDVKDVRAVYYLNGKRSVTTVAMR